MPRSRPSGARTPAETSAASASVGRYRRARRERGPRCDPVRHRCSGGGPAPAARLSGGFVRARPQAAAGRGGRRGSTSPGRGSVRRDAGDSSHRADGPTLPSAASTLPARFEDTGDAPAKGRRRLRPGAADLRARAPARPGIPLLAGDERATSVRPVRRPASLARLPLACLPLASVYVKPRKPLERTVPAGRGCIDGGGARRLSQRAATTSTDAAPLTISRTPRRRARGSRSTAAAIP